MNIRRRLIVALGAGALTAPFGAFAQRPARVWRVGFLNPRRRPDSLDTDIFGAFRLGMREFGYVEGKNLVIEWRFADNKVDLVHEQAAELVRLKVDLILAGGPTALPAHKATNAIPIVFVSANDPVGVGLVKSLARPGGNITGLTSLTVETGAKRLEMLLAMVPGLSRVAMLINAENPLRGRQQESIQAAAGIRRVTILPTEVRTPQEIESAFPVMVREKAAALIVPLDPLFQQQRGQIAALSAKHRLPSIGADQIYAESGCLMSYGNSLADDFRRAAFYVDKIFKGARPGDLPVEQPAKLELVVNLKTAKAIGITIPQSLLLRADRVIE